MVTTLRIRRLLTNLGHFAALAFATFWLVATSAPIPPARDCYTGIASPTTLRVVLGSSANPRPVPTCQGIDGLTTGSELVFDLSLEEPFSGCRDYSTRAVSGLNDVTIVPASRSNLIREEFTSLWGTFSSSSTSGCTGQWELALAPAEIPPLGQVISPLDAGSSQKWVLQRRIQEDTLGACADLFVPPTAGQAAFCEDEFEVSMVVEEPAAP